MRSTPIGDPRKGLFTAPTPAGNPVLFSWSHMDLTELLAAPDEPGAPAASGVLTFGWLDGADLPGAPRCPGVDHTWLATQLDRAGFGFLQLDGSNAAPDPLVLAPLVVDVTWRLGVVAPVTITEQHPWMFARAMATLDHLSGGRIAWSVSASGAADPEWAARTAEYADVLEQLWSSWDPEALAMDRETNVYVDHTKVRPIHFEGRYYASRGPLNTLPPPQGRPPLVHRVRTPADLEVAVAAADAVVAAPGDAEAGAAFGARLQAEARAAGRSPIPLFLVISPELATEESERSDDGVVMSGSPDSITERIARLRAATHCAGLVVRPATGGRRYVSEVVDELFPMLVAEGLARVPTGDQMLRSTLSTLTEG